MTEKNQNQSIVLYISIGMLIPILVALIPYGHQFLFPEHDLNYSILSKTKVNDFSAVSIKLQNDGEKAEKNIEIIIKKNNYLFSFENKDNDSEPIIDIDPEIPYKFTQDSKSYFITLVNMRLGEKVTVSVLSKKFVLADYDKDVVQVRTEDNIARLNVPSEFFKFAYPFTSWMFIILMCMAFVTGIYQEYFENPKKREERLLKEIDKLKK